MTFDASNTDAAPRGMGIEAPAPACRRCATGHLHQGRISTAFWRGQGLVVVRNIPAMICGACGEEYVEDGTAVGLDRLRGAGFATGRVADRMIVPIFDFVDALPGEG